MDVKTHLATLEASTEFSDWKKEHPNSFLAHVFRMLDGEQDAILTAVRTLLGGGRGHRGFPRAGHQVPRATPFCRPAAPP